VTLHSSTYAVQCTGLTYRRLSYWEAKKAIVPAQPPEGSGSRIGWSDDDIARLQVIASVNKVIAHTLSRSSTDLIATIWSALAGLRHEWPEILYLWFDNRWHAGRQPGLTTGAFLCVDVVFVLRDAGMAA
jgi:hypothetical protein